jgi:nucleotide-binding universal stress UspA family protein
MAGADLAAMPPKNIGTGRPLRAEVIGASAADDLASFAAMAGADLIAAGAPQKHALGDFLRGTATDRIVQHSECPVLIVNASAARRERVAVDECACAV